MFHVKQLAPSILQNPIVSRETRERLAEFAALLSTWSKHINLVSRADRARLWDRHILDCAMLGQLIPPSVTSAIDLGSGAGFPGLILAITTGVRFTLIESDQRKAAFLNSAVDATDAPAQVIAGRIEQCFIPAASLITSRALAPIPVLLELSAHLRTHDCMCLFPKSAAADQEIAAATNWTMVAQRFRSPLNAAAVVWRLSEIRRVDRS